MKRKFAVLLTAATVFSAVLPTTCMAAENKADIPEGTTITFWHAMGGVNGEALDIQNSVVIRSRSVPIKKQQLFRESTLNSIMLWYM